MKRPRHMTLRELTALPVLRDGNELCKHDLSMGGDRRYGGAFRDGNGYVWGTLRTSAGWARYPAYLSLIRARP